MGDLRTQRVVTGGITFPPYSKCVCLICNASAAIPKRPSGPQVKHFERVDHVELVILKVALK